MLMPRTLSQTLFAIVFIAIQAVNTLAHAQFGSKNGLEPVVTTERVRAELLAHAPQGVTAGNDDKITPNTVWVGLQLAHQPKWHTYWKNSGDSGLPTQLVWTLPVGVLAGDIAWPAPQKIRIGSLANYGYEGTVLLAVPLTITPAFKPSLLNSHLDIKLKAQWLICKQECIPEEGEFALSIPTKGSTAINAAVFAAAWAAQPKLLAGSSAQLKDSAVEVKVAGLPAALQGKTLELFAETAEVIDTAATPTQAWQGDVWTATVPLSGQRSQSPAVMPIVLKSGDQAWRTEAVVQGAWPKVAAAAVVSPGLAAALAQNKAAVQNANLTAAPVNITLLAALLGALLGGMILNLMPCVFPILALKVVGFTGMPVISKRTGAAVWPTLPAWCCHLWRWVRCFWRCGRRASSWAGVFSCKTRWWWRVWRCFSPCWA
jgi:DsbC/DsbD-like thiol-disulfide interchange protein